MFDDEFDDDTPGTLAVRDQLTPMLATMLPVDPDGAFTDEEIFQFYELSHKVYGPEEIAWSLGWSPLKLRQFLANDERTALLESVREALNQGMERAVYRSGKGGNVTAQRLWLFCQARHRGWADTRQVHVVAQSRQEVLISVAQGVRETLNAGIIEHGESAIAALQAAYVHVETDDEIAEAEIV